jgi:hypothetical protein
VPALNSIFNGTVKLNVSPTVAVVKFIDPAPNPVINIFGPVGPEAPETPEGPVGPVAPPGDPEGPIVPEGPATPEDPAGPVGPVAPSRFPKYKLFAIRRALLCYEPLMLFFALSFAFAEAHYINYVINPALFPFFQNLLFKILHFFMKLFSRYGRIKILGI